MITERNEIRTSDPQDVKRIGNLNYLAIADSEDGIMTFDLEKNEFYKKSFRNSVDHISNCCCLFLCF